MSPIMMRPWRPWIKREAPGLNIKGEVPVYFALCFFEIDGPKAQATCCSAAADFIMPARAV